MESSTTQFFPDNQIDAHSTGAMSTQGGRKSTVGGRFSPDRLPDPSAAFLAHSHLAPRPYLLQEKRNTMASLQLCSRTKARHNLSNPRADAHPPIFSDFVFAAALACGMGRHRQYFDKRCIRPRAASPVALREKRPICPGMDSPSRGLSAKAGTSISWF